MTKQKFKNLFLFFIFYFLFFVFPARAAQIYFEPNNQTLGLGQRFISDIFINTENENINAIEGKIVFSSDLLQIEDISDGNSIINPWIQKPTPKNNEITFAGLIVNGYTGSRGKIFSMIFKTNENLPIKNHEIEGVIEVNEIKALLNDGKGTETKTKSSISNFKFTLSKEIPLSSFSIVSDQIPPEFFKPEITSNPQIFNEKSFLVFAAQDLQSGLDYYEVKEGRADFIKAESPYLLKNQRLNEEIIVRAVDKASNVREVALAPQKDKPFYSDLSFWTIAAFLCLILYFSWRLIKKWKN